MKKIILSALLIGGAATAVNAQANSVLVFGDLGIHTVKDETDTKNFRFNIHPGVGYQFDDHWTLGVTGSFGTRRTKPSTARDWNYVNDYSAGAFVRYTMPIGKIFAFYSQLEAGYLGSTAGNTGPSNPATPNITSNGFQSTLTPAIAILIHDGFALNFGFGGIGFSTEKVSGAAHSTTSFDLTWGTQFNIGVSKNFSCGRHHRRHHGHMMNHGSKVEKEDADDEKSED